ncbi:helix-turn-helix domain-containing protein [Georgenia alba]|uniref:Helix-turn-helix domain-containing protein n=1 Tax=Georgenia alba TaxID=2233858 RepID=A0ABW2Q3F6_9MICO
MAGGTGSVGDLLREWRHHRQLSQLDLALQAEVSARHVSLVETGKSRPSAEMVLRLASALDVPLRHRNRLLLAAGFAPRYQERDLEAPDMSSVREALVTILRAHEPYPAVVMDRRWNVLMTNAGVELLQDGVDADLLHPRANLVRLSLDPRGLAPRIGNIADVRNMFRARLSRQLAEDADPEITDLYDTYVAPHVDGSAAAPAGGEVVGAMTLQTPEQEVRLFSTVTTFCTPQDITLQEIAVELFYPADGRTAQVLASGAGGREMAGTLPGGGVAGP